MLLMHCQVHKQLGMFETVRAGVWCMIVQACQHQLYAGYCTPCGPGVIEWRRLCQISMVSPPHPLDAQCCVIMLRIIPAPAAFTSPLHITHHEPPLVPSPWCVRRRVLSSGIGTYRGHVVYFNDAVTESILRIPAPELSGGDYTIEIQGMGGATQKLLLYLRVSQGQSGS